MICVQQQLSCCTYHNEVMPQALFSCGRIAETKFVEEVRQGLLAANLPFMLVIAFVLVQQLRQPQQG